MVCHLRLSWVSIFVFGEKILQIIYSEIESEIESEIIFRALPKI